MTIEEFNNLKVGDMVYVRKSKNYNSFSTEVVEIDRFFKKIRVVCKSKFISYRCISKKSIPVSSYVGTCKYN